MSFIALHTREEAGKMAMAFSPKVMRWDAHTWLIDLRPTISFWRRQAETLGMGVESYLRRALEKLFSTEAGISIIGGEGAFSASMAPHPWQAVLLLYQMQERRRGSLLFWDHGVGEQMIPRLSWDVWWQACERIQDHLQQIKKSKFKRGQFGQQMLKMHHLVMSLGKKTPFELRRAESLAIRRRFGSVMAELWRWTWEELPKTLGGIEGFPWVDWHPMVLPEVERHLEFPLIEWEHLKPFLTEDLDRLCRLEIWDSREKVVSLRLTLISYDMREVEIEVVFRHPHSLCSELGGHDTTLTQLYYAFEEAMTLMQKSAEEDGVPASLSKESPAISWRLQVMGRLELSERFVDLFGEVKRGEENVRQVENRLSVALRRYSLTNDWTPEGSYDEFVEGEEMQDPSSSILSISQQRPLFLLKDKTQIKSSVGIQFLERTMAKWWLPDAECYRDYYLQSDSKGRFYWIYSNDRGEWFRYGIFA